MYICKCVNQIIYTPHQHLKIPKKQTPQVSHGREKVHAQLPALSFAKGIQSSVEDNHIGLQTLPHFGNKLGKLNVKIETPKKYVYIYTHPLETKMAGWKTT